MGQRPGFFSKLKLKKVSFAFQKKEKIIKNFVFVGVHRVNGNFLAIQYLRDTNPKYVEGLFFMAKKYGVCKFEWASDGYEIKRNPDLSFAVIKISTEETKSILTFKKKK